MARIWRDGQSRPCTVYRLHAVGGMDEKLLQRLHHKAQLECALADGGAAAVGSENGVIGEGFLGQQGDDCRWRDRLAVQQPTAAAAQAEGQQYRRRRKPHLPACGELCAYDIGIQAVGNRFGGDRGEGGA